MAKRESYAFPSSNGSFFEILDTLFSYERRTGYVWDTRKRNKTMGKRFKTTARERPNKGWSNRVKGWLE